MVGCTNFLEDTFHIRVYIYIYILQVRTILSHPRDLDVSKH
jgi:hypothetical protein